MMLKPKICFTVFVIYEIVAVMLMHCPASCNAMFSSAFCADSVYKYFIICAAIPAIVGLIIMWIMEIVHAVRRRHSMWYKAREAVHHVASDLGHTVRENVTVQDIEKYLTTAVLVGAKKYAEKHPNVRKTFENVLNTVRDQADEYIEMPRKASTPKKKK